MITLMLLPLFLLLLTAQEADKDIKPNQMLQYDYWSGFSGLEDKPENYSLATYELECANNKTTLLLRQTGFADEKMHQHSFAAWSQVLGKIKELSEK
jgi:hypothetical protein